MIFNIKCYDVIIDDEDYEKIKNVKWCRTGPGDPYFQGRINKKRVKLHRIIMSCPDGMIVDHVNGNTLDNRKSNLRICKFGDNLKNKKVRSDNLTGFKGVEYDKECKVYRASICVNYKRIRLGRYKTPEQAHEAYCQASKKYHGEYGRAQ